MELSKIRLRSLGISLRIAVTCLILILAGGLLASVMHMTHHYENKDEEPGLSLVDIRASFHGVHQPSRLKAAIQGSMRKYLADEEEYQSLMTWLESDRISEDYDSLELGDYAPAEILAMNCLRCHGKNAREGGSIWQTVPLEYWEDVKKLAFTKAFDPVPISILTTSFHTHALTMPLIALVAALLFLGTGWGNGFKQGLIMLTFVALLVDFSSWWLARVCEPFCSLIVLGGGAFGGLVALQLLLVFLSTWFGKSAEG